MKPLQILLILLVSFIGISDAFACRVPDFAKVEIKRGYEGKSPSIVFYFQWNDTGDPTGCEPGDAVEFEIIIRTDPEKCFAQPIGGRDEDKKDPAVRFDNFVGYVDVWNYFFDYSKEEAQKILVGQCDPGIDNEWAKRAVNYEYLGGEIEDEFANFSVGTTNTMQFKLGEMYGVRYALDLVDTAKRPECDIPAANWGHTQVNMTIIPNTCELDGIGLFDDITVDCPHLLGFPPMLGFDGCENYIEPDPYTLQHRICAPTGGMWTIQEPNSVANAHGGGYCEDIDGDLTFANVPGYEMNGHNVGDCNDEDRSTTEGDSFSSVIQIAHPPRPNEDFNKSLVVVPLVKDSDGIKQFTLTVDDVTAGVEESHPCRVRFYPLLKGQEFEPYVMVMDLEACLGSNYGTHFFKVWAVDQCGNPEESEEITFNYVAFTDFHPCYNAATGEVLELDYDFDDHLLDFRYKVKDADGLIFSTLNLNSVNEDRCKLRSYIPPTNPFNEYIVTEANMDVEYCLFKDSLESASIWTVDRCGGIENVHTYVVPP